MMDNRVEAALAGATLENLDRDRIGLQYPFRCEQQPFPTHLVMFQAHTSGQARARRSGQFRLGGIRHLALSGRQAPGGM